MTEDYSTALLQSTLDALPDGILIVSAARTIAYCNDRFRELWGIPTNVDIFDENNTLLQYAVERVENPLTFVSNIERLHNSTDFFEDELKLIDGRVYKRRSVSVNDDNLGCSRVWIFSDITEIKNSEIDTLTGVFNRKRYEKDFQPRLSIASEDSLTGVAILDVDLFKEFNDSYGHQAGDALLRSVGEVLDRCLQRKTDCGYRIGGDEFLLLYGGRTREDIIRFVENICSAIENLHIPHAINSAHNRATVSIGLGIVSGPSDHFSVFQQVDTALYQAKEKGRNRVSIVDIP